MESIHDGLGHYRIDINSDILKVIIQRIARIDVFIFQKKYPYQIT